MKRNFLILRGYVDNVPAHAVSFGAMSMLQYQVEGLVRCFPDANIYVMAEGNGIYPMSLRVKYVYNSLWENHDEAGDLDIFFGRHQKLDNITIIKGNTVFRWPDANFLTGSTLPYVVTPTPHELTHTDSIGISISKDDTNAGMNALCRFDFISPHHWSGIAYLIGESLQAIKDNIFSTKSPKRLLFEVFNDMLQQNDSIKIPVYHMNMKVLDVRSKKEIAHAKKYHNVDAGITGRRISGQPKKHGCNCE
jgi:hypothetical protein